MKEWQWLGQTKPRVYIGKAQVTGKFMVYLQFRQEVVGISPHRTKAGAQFGLAQCQQCVDSFPVRFWKPGLQACLSAFIERLNAEYDYPDDDELLATLDRSQPDDAVLRPPTPQEKAQASEFYL